MAWTEHLGRLRGRGVRRGLGDALYAIAALWLSAFTAYLVYLLLPFEYLAIGLFELSPIVIIGSALLAGIVTLALLVWLVRRLLRPAWRGEAIGGWRFGIVVALAVATVALDAGRTHYLVPLPPTDQDDCSFGPISRQEYGTIAHEMERKFDPDWLAVFAQRGFKREFERQLMTALPETASEAEMIARIHALARAIGTELDTEGYYNNGQANYDYRFDFNHVPFMRQIVFRWAEIQFNIVKLNDEVKLEDVLIFLPTIKGREQHPPRERICPSLPQPARQSSISLS